MKSTIEGDVTVPCMWVSQESQLHLDHVTVSRCGNIQGPGPVYAEEYTTINIRSSYFLDNRGDAAAGVYILPLSSLTIEDSLFPHNEGTIAAIYSNTAYVDIRNTTFSFNQSNRGGEGAIIALYNSLSKIRSCTFTGNKAAGGDNVVTCLSEPGQVFGLRFDNNNVGKDKIINSDCKIF